MKGILFKPEMYDAVVSGKKTQTRRIALFKKDKNLIAFNLGGIKVLSKPRYNIGETVYLKEPYYIDDIDPDTVFYKFSGLSDFDYDWKNKLFMPESCARNFIKITKVSTERINDISESDCIAEGIEAFTKDGSVTKYGLDGWEWPTMPRTEKDAYKRLWISINGKESWESNPFVFVYEFEFLGNNK